MNNVLNICKINCIYDFLDFFLNSIKQNITTYQNITEDHHYKLHNITTKYVEATKPNLKYQTTYKQEPPDITAAGITADCKQMTFGTDVETFLSYMNHVAFLDFKQKTLNSRL